MQKLQLLLRKEDIDNTRIGCCVVVVIDVLFATSTIAAALQHGAAEIIPVHDQTVARAVARSYPAGSFIVAGEENALPIAGFAGATPLAMLQAGVAGKAVVYATTNGTPALCKAAGAKAVYAASLLNGAAVATHIRNYHRRESVLIVCAGSAGLFAAEDLFGAGHLIHHLMAEEQTRWQLSDAALVARLLYEHGPWTAEDWLLRSRIGRLATGMQYTHEIRYAAGKDLLDVVPILEGTRLRAWVP